MIIVSTIRVVSGFLTWEIRVKRVFCLIARAMLKVEIKPGDLLFLVKSRQSKTFRLVVSVDYEYVYSIGLSWNGQQIRNFHNSKIWLRRMICDNHLVHLVY